MIVGSPLLSYLSNRVFRARKPVLVLSSLITLGITALLAFQTAQLSTLALFGLCLGLGIFSSAIVVIGFTANKELFPVQMAGTAMGLVNLFPFAGGAVFQPVLGYLLERQGRVEGAFTLAGYQQAFLALLACAAIALGASCLVRETLKRN
jgi:sugar phosphate permease